MFRTLHKKFRSIIYGLLGQNIIPIKKPKSSELSI